MSSTASTHDGLAAGATERLAGNETGWRNAASLLAGGRLVAFPTETVYGLGAAGDDPAAVAALYAAKGRPRFNPLIAHVAGFDAARQEGIFSDDASRLAEAFWPGPLTLVLPVADGGTVCDLARAGLPTIGLRVPDHPDAREILARVGRPVVAPSANRSGHVSPTTADHVLADLAGRIAAILDGGPTPVGVESTIVGLTDGTPRLLRAGGLLREAIEAALGRTLSDGPAEGGDRPLAPGLLASHYAPRSRVRLEAATVEPGETVLLFGPGKPPGLEEAAEYLDLSPSGDLAEAAANLFGHLRRLDAVGAASIAVVPIPDRGLGEAINDRLRRAAADR